MTAEHTAIAVLGATLAAFIAVTHPALIPAMTMAGVAWGALALYLKS
ncbi:hypothetical protein [Streptomyces bauhiniae]|nr:hypothetical protein [Streptomyces bauhiniae]